jgi:primary-amine oxidase
VKSTLVSREFDPEAPPQHILDSLLPSEIRTAAAAIRGVLGDATEVLFSLMLLEEPSRESSAGSPPERRVRVVTLNQRTHMSEEWVVALPHGEVVGHDNLTARGITAQPPIVVDEFIEVERIVKESAEWQAAMRKRGITDFEIVQVDPMSAGNFGFENERGLRIVRAVCYLPKNLQDNAYAHPIDGLVTYVDLTNGQVLTVVDDELFPIPDEDSNFHDDNGVVPRDDLKPLEILQPEGPSFTVDGWKVSWQKWSLRVSMNAREGMVLHDICYDDDGQIRTVVDRMAFAEMVVPYGDPRPSHFWRSAFDVGEYGLGALANSLSLGCDCLGSIYYFDAYFCVAGGNPYTLDRAICLHEEDYGVLWRGANWRQGGSWVRRSRRLVISYWTTVGNYDFGFFWYFSIL